MKDTFRRGEEDDTKISSYLTPLLGSLDPIVFEFEGEIILHF